MTAMAQMSSGTQSETDSDTPKPEVSNMREEKVHRRDVLDDHIGEDLVGNVYENTKYGYRVGVREYHVNENEDKLVLMCEHLGSNGSETLLLDDILGSRWEHVHGETEYVHQ